MVLALALAGCGGGGGSSPGNPLPPVEVSLTALKAGETVRSGTYTVSGDPVEVAAFYVAWARLEEARMKIESGESLDVGGLSLKCSGSEECGLEIDVDAETVTVTGTIEISEFMPERPPASGTGGRSGGSGGLGGGGNDSVRSMIPEVNITTGSLTVNEDVATEITVRLDRPAPGPGLTLTFSVSGNAAREDFEMISVEGVTVNDQFTKITVTIPEGDNSITVPVRINDDNLPEGRERLVLTLDSGNNGYRRGNRYAFTLTINESDGGSMTGPIEVGTGDVEKNGALTLERVKGALAGFDPSSGGVNGPLTLEEGASHWGVWLSDNNQLTVWHGPPTTTAGTQYVGDVVSSGTATYGGSVRGLGHYEASDNTEKYGEFTAGISLRANFTDDMITGTVSNFSGAGADPAWGTVTLNTLSGANSTGGTVSGGETTGGSWGYQLYRRDETGDPDGATGYVDLNFAAISEENGGGTESAVGAFHAIKR